MSSDKAKDFPTGTADYVRMVIRRREWTAEKQMAVARRYMRMRGVKIVGKNSDGTGDVKGPGVP
jgi:hypothetical protein